MNRTEKQEEIAFLADQFTKAQASILVDYKGVNCEDLTEIRGALLKKGARLKVVKNTLARRAIQGEEFEHLQEKIVGPVAVIWADDAPSVAKVVAEFAKENENFSVTAGVLEGKVVDEKELEVLASMPSREELLAKLLSVINTPAIRLLQTVKEPASQVARLLGAWSSELEDKGKSE